MIKVEAPFTPERLDQELDVRDRWTWHGRTGKRLQDGYYVEINALLRRIPELEQTGRKGFGYALFDGTLTIIMRSAKYGGNVLRVNSVEGIRAVLARLRLERAGGSISRPTATARQGQGTRRPRWQI